MAVVSMKKLLEAGVHFGHQTRRRNPKMAPYIYTARNDIYIIDLQKTTKKIDEAYSKMKAIAEAGGKVLFVGTKKQAQESVKTEAERSGSFYVNTRWLGGTLTNFKTIKLRINRLKEIEAMEEDGSIELYTKKEQIQIKKEKERLEKFLGGIKEMKKMPDAIFVVDPKVERNAVLEARKLKIPVFGIVDTNCDPDDVDFVIPANDDAIRAVKLIITAMADSIVEAKGGVLEVAYTKDEPSNNDYRKPRDNNNRNYDNKNKNYENRNNNRSYDNRPARNERKELAAEVLEEERKEA